MAKHSASTGLLLCGLIALAFCPGRCGAFNALVSCPPGPNDLTVVAFYGEAQLDNFGMSLACAGDFNGDGIVDLVVGAPFADAGARDGGAAYVFLGGTESDPNYSFRLLAEGVDDHLGLAVAGIGDFDGDGFDDIAVGARYNDRAGIDKGAVWIVFGSEPPFGSRQMVLTCPPGGPKAFGHALAAGDFNGDGYPDLVVSAPFDLVLTPQTAVRGRVYVYFGGPDMDNGPDVVLEAEAFNHEFGWSVANAGDVNGDGVDDLIVGARYYGTLGNAQRGKAYIYFGGPQMNSVPDVELVGENTYCWLGYSVAGAGDINGDGYADVLIGSPYYPGGGSTNPAFGRTYVLFGGPAMNNVPDLILNGAAAHDQFGWSVAGGMDFNGDGYDDFIVGARFNNCGNINAGSAYLYYGGPSLDANADVIVSSSAADDALGTTVAMIGDWTGTGAPMAAAAAVWNDAGMVVSNPMTEGAFGAVFAFALGDASPPSADFSGTPVAGEPPLAVEFRDLSTGLIDQRLWDFGDGAGSTAKDPNHVYLEAGNYTVSLTVSGPGGVDAKIKEGYITVGARPDVPGDLDGSGCVDWRDLHIFSLWWLHTECGAPEWCGGADIDLNTVVDFADLALLAKDWLDGCEP